MGSGTAFAQALPTASPDATASATLPVTGASAVPFVPNPQFFGGRGRPHVLPMRSPEYFQSAPLPPASAHLTYYGGRVVSNLQVVQVIWGAGSYLPQVTSTSTPSMASFYQEVLNSSYVDWLTEYDTTGLPTPTSSQTIGRGSFLHQYVITPSTTSTTVDDSTIQTEIAAQIAAGHLPAPTTDGNGNTNTYYAIFFPNGTTITQGGTSSCVGGGFCAYHGTVAPAGSLREFFYGVHPDMQAGSGCDTGCGAGSPFGNYTSVASHEMTETITDSEVGLAQNFAPPLAWYDGNNGEIGDICNAQQGTVTGADGVTYTVQQEWSNAQSACVVKGAGSGGGALFTVTPPTLAFAHQYVYETSLAEVVTVTNTGNVSLAKPTLSITGTDHASFSDSTTCTAAIAVGTSCTIKVKFTPTTTGAKSATLTVTISGTPAKTVAITGTAVAAPYTLSPRALAFGNCTHGTTCNASTVVTVKNTGAAAVPIASLTLSGASHALFSKTTTCGTSLAVGKTCTISVTFSPTTTGSATASLSVNTGSGDGTQTVALSGKGI
jgi:hypothetical protein